MSTIATEFEQLDQRIGSGGIGSALEQLEESLRQKKRYHDVYEVLKMKVRHELGLPIRYAESGSELDDEKRSKLESGLFDACRDVGLALLRDGAIREGWMYLRYVDERDKVAAELAKIAVDDDNLDALIEVLLHEGVDPARGFALVLENHGTCNAITLYEQALPNARPEDQQAAAGVLVEQVHRDLLGSVRADIAQQEGQEPQEPTLRELVSDRDWLFGQHSYHLDTTHLASTVRFARALQDAGQLRLALDLTEYGRRLDTQFQYPGEEPFVDFYPASALYLGALLGEQIDEAIAYFREKATSLDVAEHGSEPIETLVNLLDRCGRYSEAVGALITFAESQQGSSSQMVNLLLDLAEKSGDFAAAKEFFRRHDDLLGYTACLALERQS